MAIRPSSSILFIGNSFTNRNDLPGSIRQLGASAHPPRHIETERVIANGMALKSHWDRGAALEAIQRESWDFVVLQEQSTLPLKNRKRMHESVTLFDGEIKRGGAKTVLYMTWARQNVPERQDELSEAYTSIGRALGALVVPVGIAWQRVQKEHPEVVLYDRDKSHPSPAGSYLAACVFFASLFNQSPVGLTEDVAGLQKADATTPGLLQQSAWSVVQTTR